MAGAYRSLRQRPGSCGTMTHAHTICDCLCVTSAFTYPALSKEWGRRFVDTLRRVLLDMALTGGCSTVEELLLPELVEQHGQQKEQKEVQSLLKEDQPLLRMN